MRMQCCVCVFVFVQYVRACACLVPPEYETLPAREARRKRKKSRQHSDFPGGHPPEYYPSLRLLNFAERTGYGVLSLRWPSTKESVSLATRLLLTRGKTNTLTHLKP